MNDEQGRTTMLNRRQALQGAAGAAALGMARPGVAQGSTKVRVGYLHTLAVDGQIWVGMERGSFAKQGLDLELRQFNTGLELFQAMVGGSLDMLATGAVLSNFPARGQGKVFLINNVEFATAQLWVREDQGIKGFADLKGKRIATTTGTTAHVFLDTALRANGVDPKDVELLNQRMPDAVTSFISGAVPAVALWVPFNITVRDKVPGAKKLVDAGAFYPKAAIVGGWAARNDYYEQNREVCARLVKGWVEANDYFIANPDAALTSLQKNNYSQVPIGDLREQYAAQKMFTSAEWKKLYADGTVTTWLQQVTDFFASVANIPSPVPASTYFDPKLFLSTAGA
jgi:NitT/TauT family transport system substrate-binding protein